MIKNSKNNFFSNKLLSFTIEMALYKPILKTQNHLNMQQNNNYNYCFLGFSIDNAYKICTEMKRILLAHKLYGK